MVNNSNVCIFACKHIYPYTKLYIYINAIYIHTNYFVVFFFKKNAKMQKPNFIATYVGLFGNNTLMCLILWDMELIQRIG